MRKKVHFSNQGKHDSTFVSLVKHQCAQLFALHLLNYEFACVFLFIFVHVENNINNNDLFAKAPFGSEQVHGGSGIDNSTINALTQGLLFIISTFLPFLLGYLDSSTTELSALEESKF